MKTPVMFSSTKALYLRQKHSRHARKNSIAHTYEKDHGQIVQRGESLFRVHPHPVPTKYLGKES